LYNAVDENFCLIITKQKPLILNQIANTEYKQLPSLIMHVGEI